MATIAAENRKHLRQAMRVECGFQETSDEPTSITPIGNAADLEGLENLERSHYTTIIMDLSGSGFLNDGEAVPMQTDTDSYRYGYISEDATKSDGTFETPFGLTLTAGEDWDYVTLEVMGQHGDKQTVLIEPVWVGGSTTIYLDTWTPGERVYIVGVFLGKAWLWNNESLLGVNLDLHSVNTELGGELEVSSIEIQAYETTDYTQIIGRVPIGSPIWYAAGYPGDMSEIRRFYLSETITWDDNVLTVHGQDASMLLDNVEVPVVCMQYGSGWYVDDVVAERIRDALDTISYTEVGTVPVHGIHDSQPTILDAKAARSIISEYTGMFRDEGYLRATYVDAGRPTLTFGEVGNNWTIYADEISDLNVVVENNKNTLQIVLPEYYPQYNASIEEVQATAGKIYYVTLDPPCSPSNVFISPTPTSSEQISCSLFKFVAAATTNYTISGYEIIPNLLDANNPYDVSNSEKGETYDFGFEMPLFVLDDDTSLTKYSLAGLLNRSNICYEFTYRGNPHIQPRDVLNVEIAVWEDQMITIDGLLPAEDLYPAENLYPYGVYEKARKMVRTWVTMTVDTVTLEHTDSGGLTSKIKARKGAV